MVQNLKIAESKVNALLSAIWKFLKLELPRNIGSA